MSETGVSLHPAFRAALEEDREQINQQFKFTSLEGSPLDGQAFQLHLATRVNAIVAATDECLPERSRVVSSTLISISLQLFRAGFWGPQSRLPLLDQLWESILPRLAPFVARDPQRVAGSLSNALVNLTQHDPPTAERWLKRLGSIGSACSSVADLLDAGRVAAWLSGRADLRGLALDLLTRLPKNLTCQLLELDGRASDTAVTQAIECLRANHWLDLKSMVEAVTTSSAASLPPKADSPARLSQPAIVKRVGAFTGFGGPFQTPPVVSYESGQFYVRDVQSRWRLVADAFGAVLERVSADSTNATDSTPGQPASKTHRVKRSRDKSTTGAPQISAGGDLTWGTESKRLLQLAQPTSQAFDGETLAVTLANSFHVILIAPFLTWRMPGIWPINESVPAHPLVWAHPRDYDRARKFAVRLGKSVANCVTALEPLCADACAAVVPQR